MTSATGSFDLSHDSEAGTVTAVMGVLIPPSLGSWLHTSRNEEGDQKKSGGQQGQVYRVMVRSSRRGAPGELF